jgi:hypothetical protein
MFKTPILAVLAFSCGTSAFDEYAPVAPGTFTVEPQFAYSSITGLYDASGSTQNLPSGTSMTGQGYGLQLKIGTIGGLDLEASILYDHATAENDLYSTHADGFFRPDLSLKYLFPVGLGAFAGVDLPVGGQEVVGIDPSFSYYFGGLVVQRSDKLSFNGLLLYEVTLENGEKYAPGDVIQVVLKPQINVTEVVGPYLELQYQKVFDGTLDGQSLGASGYLATLQPGANLSLTRNCVLEVGLPFTVAGKNGYSAWGLLAQVRVSMRP